VSSTFDQQLKVFFLFNASSIAIILFFLAPLPRRWNSFLFGLIALAVELGLLSLQMGVKPLGCIRSDLEISKWVLGLFLKNKLLLAAKLLFDIFRGKLGFPVILDRFKNF